MSLTSRIVHRALADLEDHRNNWPRAAEHHAAVVADVFTYAAENLMRRGEIKRGAKRHNSVEVELRAMVGKVVDYSLVEAQIDDAILPLKAKCQEAGIRLMVHGRDGYDLLALPAIAVASFYPMEPNRSASASSRMGQPELR